MIEVSEAIKIINETKINLPAIEIPIEHAIGRVLRQDIVADADFPPFHRVMMDGIGVKWEDFAAGIREYDVVGIQGAGAPQQKLSNPGTCIEVMTGAVAPEGADLVIPYEDIDINREKHLATVHVEKIENGKNIHKQGTDKLKGDLLVSSGKKLDAPEIAIAASVGLTTLKVTKNPRIAIISTGNELVDISDEPLPHQIRKSNVYALQAELMKLGLKAEMFHLSDQKDVMREILVEIMENHHIVLMSGGVSKGKFDYVPEILEALGVEKRFHLVRQKPGKPLMFGEKKGKNVVFAFPGNPVSTFMCFHRYFLPWLKQELGEESNLIYKAILAEDISIKTRLTFYLQVKTEIDSEGKVLAAPVMGRGSGDHANLLDSNAFLELPADTYHFKKGEVFNLFPFRNM